MCKRPKGSLSQVLRAQPFKPQHVIDEILFDMNTFNFGITNELSKLQY